MGFGSGYHYTKILGVFSRQAKLLDGSRILRTDLQVLGQTQSIINTYSVRLGPETGVMACDFG